MEFWSSVDLTGNQTGTGWEKKFYVFWSSVDLTGNQTSSCCRVYTLVFWSSVDLTGNQTQKRTPARSVRFGAVSI